MSLENVVEVGIITPNGNDVIVVKVDYSKIIPSARKEYSENLAKELEKFFPENKVLIIKSDMNVNLQKYSDESVLLS